MDLVALYGDVGDLSIEGRHVKRAPDGAYLVPALHADEVAEAFGLSRTPPVRKPQPQGRRG